MVCPGRQASAVCEWAHCGVGPAQGRAAAALPQARERVRTQLRSVLFRSQGDSTARLVLETCSSPGVWARKDVLVQCCQKPEMGKKKKKRYNNNNVYCFWRCCWCRAGLWSQLPTWLVRFQLYHLFLRTVEGQREGPQRHSTVIFCDSRDVAFLGDPFPVFRNGSAAYLFQVSSTTALFCAVQYCTVLYCTVWYSTVIFCGFPGGPLPCLPECLGRLPLPR